MRIVSLARHHEEALAAYLAEFAAAGETTVPAWFADPSWSWADTVDAVAAWSRGERQNPGQVPCTTLLLEHDDALLGVANLRHALNDNLARHGGHVGYSVRPSARGQGHATRLLTEALDLARDIGVDRALLTCAPDNTPSVRVIEKCGGVLQDELFHEGVGHLVRRYWIGL